MKSAGISRAQIVSASNADVVRLLQMYARRFLAGTLDHPRSHSRIPKPATFRAYMRVLEGDLRRFLDENGPKMPETSRHFVSHQVWINDQPLNELSDIFQLPGFAFRNDFSPVGKKVWWRRPAT